MPTPTTPETVKPQWTEHLKSSVESNVEHLKEEIVKLEEEIKKELPNG